DNLKKSIIKSIITVTISLQNLLVEVAQAGPEQLIAATCALVGIVLLIAVAIIIDYYRSIRPDRVVAHVPEITVCNGRTGSQKAIQDRSYADKYVEV
ncbi:hypothetical protein PRIPAC_82966, partial [Pristionchus pacificus]|uniref:Uncharacterized protein n=1 Tax=Pristionchus pacificus TaxID=54126 RepID=A0A2A6BWY6_PRIPA